MTSDTKLKISKISKIILVISGVIGLASIILEYGFKLSREDVLSLHYVSLSIVYVFIAYSLIQVFIAGERIEYLKTHKIEFFIIFFIFVETVTSIFGYSLIEELGFVLNFEDISYLYIVFAQVYIIVGLILGGLRYNVKLLQFSIHPSRLFVLSFVVTIMLGTLLLLLPAATTGGKIRFIDALFTATSAVCVTGLSVVDTAKYFTDFGQLVIMTLIQVGGLGLMTFTTFFALLFSGGMGIKERFMMRDLLDEESVGTVTKILISLTLITFGIEFIGATILFFSISHNYSSFAEPAFISIFHSISAFCNAGFSLFSLNLMDPYIKSNYLFTTTISFLIILGGIGFPTIMSFFSFEKLNLFQRKAKSTYPLQVKIIIYSTVALIVSGAVATYFLELNHSLKGLGFLEAMHASYFQSVSARTAGFNTIDLSLFSDATSIFYSVLMFIGASPGGTGGGIKTTTFIIILFALRAILREERQVTIQKRSVSQSVVLKAFSKVFLSLIMIFIVIMILSITERTRFINVCFEAFSAFGTVGLSKGITSYLSDIGKLVILILMFFGRVGPIAFLYTLMKTREPVSYELPSENISIL
ncbi:MAG: TrkH family potassium uptake protein [Ignavibacteriaceae bacterium]